MGVKAATAAAQRVRWAPVLAAMRAVEVPVAEVQLKQQAWQAIRAGVPAATAAADAEDAMELAARADEAAEARRAVRAERGKRQAVAGAPVDTWATSHWLDPEEVLYLVEYELTNLRPYHELVDDCHDEGTC